MHIITKEHTLTTSATWGVTTKQHSVIHYNLVSDSKGFI